MGGNGKGGALLLVALLLAAAAAGAWNYRRNLTAEQAERRPFAAYSDSDLERLIEAYRGEADAWRERRTASRERRGDPRTGGLLGEQVQEFERAQRVGARQREATAEFGRREAALRDLEDEQRRRSARGNGIAVHLRRLLTL